MHKPPVILAIDDYKDNLVSVKAFVADTFPGAVVFTAENGRDGIDLARDHDPDLILLDIVMPGMDGFEVCKTIKEDPQLRTIPVIFLTAMKDDRRSRIRALEAGGEAFITKPFEEAEFTAQIRAMMKIKAANEREQREKENLSDLVAERTIQLEKELTERKKAEDELKQANLVLTQNRLAMLNILADLKDEVDSRKSINELLKTVLLNLDAIIFSIDRDGLFLLSEGKALSSLGVVPGEVVGRSAFEIYSNYPEIIRGLKISLSGEAWSGTVSIRDLAFDLHVQPVFDDSGIVSGAVGVAIDITEKQKSAEALRRSEERYRLILEATNDGFWDWDIKTGKALFSPRYFTMLGYEPGEFPSSFGEWSKLIHPADRDHIIPDLMNQISMKWEYPRIEYRVRAKSGDWIWILGRGKPVAFDQEGNVTRMIGTNTDITQLKEAELALKESEKRYRRIVDTAEEGIWEMNGEMKTEYVNRRMTEMLGYAPNEMLGKDVSTFMAQEDLDNHYSRMSRRRMGNNDRYERRFVRKDGNIVWMLVSATALIDEDGEFIGSFGMFSDITEQKRYEEMLLKSEQNYREIFNSTSEAIMIDDAETGRIIDVNETTLKMYGYSRKEEILSGNIGDLSADIPPYTQENAQESISKCLLEGPQVFEWIAKKKTGEPFWVEISLQQSDMGGKGKILAVIRDIGERKQTEWRLEESERRYRSVVENASEGIAVIRNGIVIYANPKGCELIQLPSDEIIGKPFITFIHPDDQGLILDRYNQRVLGEEVPSSYDLRLTGNKGFVTWVQISVIRIRWGGQVATLNFLIDITGRKSTEDALRESNQKLRLLSSLTRHDILNHLTTIRLNLDMALGAEEKESISNYISKASTTSEQIETIIGFTRKYEMFGITGSEWQSIYRIIESARLEISHPGISIINMIPHNLEVYADPIIQKVFSTLLDNAVRHGGIVSNIRFSMVEGTRCLNIVCNDDGTGIERDEKERIFEHGYGKHTGTGLFLAREILGITRLSIREDGEPGKGARFTIQVPQGRFRFS